MTRNCFAMALILAACTSPPPPSPPERELEPLDLQWIERYATTGRFSFGEPRSPEFTRDGRAVFFLQSAEDRAEQSLHRLDLDTGRVEQVLRSTELLGGDAVETLSDEELARRERTRSSARGIASFLASSDGNFLVLPLSGRLFRFDLSPEANPRIREVATGSGGAVLAPKLAPNDRHIAFVRDSALFVHDFDTGRTRRIASPRDEGTSVGLSEFVAQEEMGRYDGFWWSPDSRTIVYQRTDERSVTELTRTSLSKPSAEPVVQRYPRPGEANARVTLELVSVWGGSPTQVRWDRESFPYLTRVVWSENAPLTVVVQDRSQNTLVVLSADVRGKTVELHRERHPAWVNLDPTVPRWLPDGSGFIWSSEREGDWQLELRSADGQLARVLVPVSVGYRALGGIDEGGTTAVVDVGADAREQHVARVEIATGALTRFSDRKGFERTLVVGPQGEAVVRAESLDSRPMFRVYGSSGERLLPSRAAEPELELTTELLELRGERRFHAAVTRPRGAEPGERLPGIFYVYGGPTHVTVDRRASTYLRDQWLADAGFIVFRIDGRGSTRRGVDWNRAVKGDLFTAPLEDYVTAVSLLAERVPELDISRIGVFGWSFGGYASAMAVMREPEVFHAAVAGAPVIDWADYDTHYTERYLGVPENVATDPAYRGSDVRSYAEKLRRPLMVLHGTSDDNVHFVNTTKLSDALLRAGRPHQVVPIFNETHRVRNPKRVVGMHQLIVSFFREHLSGRTKTDELEDQGEAGTTLSGLK